MSRQQQILCVCVCRRETSLSVFPSFVHSLCRICHLNWSNREVLVSSSKHLSSLGPQPGIVPAPGSTQGSSALNTQCYINASQWGSSHRIKGSVCIPAMPCALNTTAHLARASLPRGPPSRYLVDGQLLSTSSRVAVVVARVVKLFIQVLLTACFLCAHSVQSSIGHPWKETQQQAQKVSLEVELSMWQRNWAIVEDALLPGKEEKVSSHPCLVDGMLQSLASLLQVT